VSRRAARLRNSPSRTVPGRTTPCRGVLPTRPSACAWAEVRGQRPVDLAVRRRRFGGEGRSI
jgi:hypothetical protein